VEMAQAGLLIRAYCSKVGSLGGGVAESLLAWRWSRGECGSHRAAIAWVLYFERTPSRVVIRVAAAKSRAANPTEGAGQFWPRGPNARERLPNNRDQLDGRVVVSVRWPSCAGVTERRAAVSVAGRVRWLPRSLSDVPRPRNF